MEKSSIIKLEDIENAPNKELHFHFEDSLEGIDSEKPISAELTFKSLGDLINVQGHVTGEAFLECDLCLEKFKYKLDIDIEEFFAKNTMLEEYGTETELKEGQFIEDLRGAKEINVSDLLYQSVILDFPNKKVCGINCKGNTFVNDEDYFQVKTDPRLEVFKNINVQKKLK